MENNPHFKALLQNLNSHKVDYMVVGGYAVMKYTEPRYTKDLNIWVRTSPQNAKRLYAALAEFGAPLASDQVTVDILGYYGMVYQIGQPPLRIDILTKISGVSFAEAWGRKQRTKMAGERVYIIGLEDLIQNKEAAGRETDLLDLKVIQNQKKGKGRQS
jgi:predicted nucleotidyltransferase